MPKNFQPFEIIKPSNNLLGDRPFVFVVDHASNHVPSALDALGLDSELLNQHIAYDIGAKHMALRLVESLGGCAVLAKFSRLLIDPNRELWRENLIPTTSDGIEIKGNANLTEQQKQARIDELYNPFHNAVEGEVQAFLNKNIHPFVVGVHSFTPEMNGFKRPWHIGFMWNEDARLGLYMAKHFEKIDKTVGHNLPYGGDDLFHTMMTHGFAHGVPHTQIEVRQDLIASQNLAIEWADMIAGGLKYLVKNPELLDSYK